MQKICKKYILWIFPFLGSYNEWHRARSGTFHFFSSEVRALKRKEKSPFRNCPPAEGPYFLLLSLYVIFDHLLPPRVALIICTHSSTTIRCIVHRERHNNKVQNCPKYYFVKVLLCKIFKQQYIPTVLSCNILHYIIVIATVAAKIMYEKTPSSCLVEQVSQYDSRQWKQFGMPKTARKVFVIIFGSDEGKSTSIRNYLVC